MAKKQTTKRTKAAPKKAAYASKLRINKKIAIILTIVIAAIGAYLMFFASAATNNCQAEGGVNICDVNQTGGGSDTVLSVGPEAEALGAQGWGWYYGAAFRAPTASYKGAVPIHRVINTQYSWHDWVTDAQKRDKEAKYGANTYEGVSFYAWENGSVAGTVPVYRITRGGSASQSMFSTDKAWVDKIVAESANNPDGWKSGTVLPAIAFYAYPPGYKVANTVNPYDCAIKENFLSDRCKMQREALLAADRAGAIPAANTCPKTYDAYKKAPFPGSLPADCQKFWNAYAQDCSKQEVFLSDNCKGPREALAAEMQRQAQLRAEEARRAAAAVRSGGGGSGGGRGGGSGGAPASGSTAAANCKDPAQYQTPFCQNFFSAVDRALRERLAQGLNPGSFSSSEPARGPVWYTCTITGQKLTPTLRAASWARTTLTKPILAADSPEATQKCIPWRSQINSLDDYRNFVITSVRRR